MAMPYEKPSQEVIDALHTYEYSRWIHGEVTYKGMLVCKHPFDIQRYQELIATKKPDLIIECGTWRGGSACMFVDMMQAHTQGARVITIDTSPLDCKYFNSNVTYINGSSTSEDVFNRVRALVESGHYNRVMVVLDSDHRMSHVLQEMKMYSELVTQEQFMVVEDSNINGHPVFCDNLDYTDGPYEAIVEFEKENDSFHRDVALEDKYLFTYYPKGWLIKK